MDPEVIKPLIERYHRKLVNVNTGFKRYLYNQINWDNRLIGIIGARGVGKTTMLLQHIVESFPNPDKALYVSLDDLWFQSNSLLDLAQWADQEGITHLFLDEVHRYKDWAIAVKNIYDTFDTLNIVYTGSSILKLQQSRADLSRRQRVYQLAGMSFREFLNLNGFDIPVYSLSDIISNHVKIASELSARMKVLPIFREYLEHGYYPFYGGNVQDYYIQLQEVLKTVIEIDLPSVTNITFATCEKAKKLLMVIADNPPTTVNITKLCEQIETTYDSGLSIMNLLDQAAVLMLFSAKPKNYKNLTRPEKIYLNNSNLMYALSEVSNIGTVREAFFLNQMMVTQQVEMPKQGDFLLNGQYLFEIGGKKKGFSQIADLPDSYLGVDDTEVGFKSRIPLWLFGLLY